MNRVQLRLPRGIGHDLFRAVQWRDGYEPVAFGFVRRAATARGELIIVREIRVAPESAYLPSRGHGARWSGAYMIALLNEALEKGCGLFVFHFHPGERVGMSGDDLNSARELMPRFQLVAPSQPHGSVVVGTGSAAGLVLMPEEDTFVDQFEFRILEERMVTWPEPVTSVRERLRFERQPLVRSSLLWQMLARTKVAVVGQSGGGTHVTQQLAQHGLGTIWGIDDDFADEGNRFAGVGVGEEDAAKRRVKVEIVGRNVQIVPSVRYIPVPARVPGAAAMEALKQADIIVGCVNNLHARADIQEVALRYAIPYVDIGLDLSTEESADEFPRIRAISGNTFTFVPGGPCMWCTEFLTQRKLDLETEFRGRPYLKTRDNAEAHVVSFNGVLASHAVNDVLNLLTGFAADKAPVYRKYDGLSGATLLCDVAKNPHCKKCQNFLAVGDALWKAA